MADATATTAKKRAPARRKPRAAASRASTRTTTTRPATRTERAQTLAERVVLIPVGAALAARDRVAGTVEELRKNLDLNVEQLTTRVEKVVQNGRDAGMKLVNGAQDRLSKVV